MKSRTFLLAAALLLATSAAAHHSFAPHFHRDREVVLVGTVVRFEPRNPHAYLHVEVLDEHGEPQVWVCESHGVTMLERNGLGRDMLAPGTPVRVEGNPARREAHGCFFRTIRFGDGTVANVDGGRPAAPSARTEAAAATTDQIYGTWLMRPRTGGGGGVASPMSDYLTEAGRRASADYDPYTDDPVLRCDTIGIRRVWFAVGTPLEISREGDRIFIRYEWMDAERVIHLDVDEFPEPLEAGTLGYSIGRFEGDELVIDTRYARGGILSQYVQLEDGSQIGLLHSDALETRERVRVDPQTGLLNVTIETHDPVYYTHTFDSVTTVYDHTDLEVEPYGCIPEVTG